MGNVITAVILIVVIGFAVRHMWMKHKNGGGCSCGCGGSCSCGHQSGTSCQKHLQQ